MSHPEFDAEAVTLSDQEKVELWRHHVGSEHGLMPSDAKLLAESDADLHRFVELVEGGCEPRTALDILL